MNPKIVAELIFMVAMILSIAGGFSLARGSILGVVLIVIGIVVLVSKWKYEAKHKEEKKNEQS